MSSQLSEAELEGIKVKLQREGIVRCPLEGCLESFKSIWGLRFHLKKNSCNAPKFKCDKCHKGFLTRVILHQHDETCIIESKKEDKVLDSVNQEKGESSGVTRATLREEVISSDNNKNAKTLESSDKDSTNVSNSESQRTIISPPDCVSTTATEEQLSKTNSSDNKEEACVFIPDSIREYLTPEESLQSSTEIEKAETSTNQSHKQLSTQKSRIDTIKDSNSKEQIVGTPKRKRGRPKKSESQPKNNINQEESDPVMVGSQVSVNTSEENCGVQEFVSTKKKLGRKKKACESHENKFVATPSRRSSRSTIKKVNYAQIDATDDEDSSEEDDDDDDDIIITQSPNNSDADEPKSKKLKLTTNIGQHVTDTETDTDKVHEKQSLNFEGIVSENGGDDQDDNDHDVDRTPTPSPIQTLVSNKERVEKKKRGRARKGEERSKKINQPKTEEAQIPTKSGQPKKDENSTRKRGRPKKVKLATEDEKHDQSETVNNIENSMNVQDKTADNSNIDSDNNCNINDKGTEIHQDAVVEENRETKNDKYEVKSTPKKRERKKATEDERMAALRQQAKKGHKIPCDNKCGSRFSSFLGYKSHMKLCGKDTPREVFKCDICNKEYQSEPGLKYHKKAVHEVKPVEEEKPIEKEPTGTDPLYSGSGRRIRNAAARAMEKVQDLKNTKVGASETTPSCKKSQVLDAYIIKQRQGLVTHAMMTKWKEEINSNGIKICPNEACHEEFTSVHVLQTHFLQCGFDEAPYKCKECERQFLSLIGARYHVSNTHLKTDHEVSKDSEDDYSEESEQSEEEDAIEISDEESELLGLKEHKTHQNRSNHGQKNKVISLAVGVVNRAYREHERWKRKNISDEQVFTEHMPMVQHWSRVEINDISEYIPVATSSPCFSIVRPDTKNHNDLEENQLPLFSSLDKNSSGRYGDCTFFSGGPVWGLYWCPTFDTKDQVDQYIVVSTHRSYETVNHAYKTHKGKGTLQLWNLGKLSSKSSRSGDSPKLSLCIAHNFGPIYKMIWCPYGTWQHPETHTEDNCLPRLGLLAVACGDGIVRILSIPHPDKLLSQLPMYSNQTANSQDKDFNQVMVSGMSLLDLVPCPLSTKYQGQRGMALCVDWSQVKPLHHIAAGFSDGSVALWNLSSKSILLTKTLENEHHTLRMAPFILIKAHSSLVRDLALCPSSQDFMVTGGEERCYKIWNLKSPKMPSLVIKKGFPYEIEWPLHTKGFFCCEQELYYKEQPSVKYYNFTTSDHVRFVCSHSSSVWSLSFNHWLNIVASSDVAGDVYLSKVPTKYSKNRWPLYKVHLEDRNSNTNSEDNKTENPDKLKQKCPSLTETIQCSQLVFRDINSLQFHNMVPLAKKEIKDPPSIYHLNTTTLQSINKVQWNPNKQAMTWIASGGVSGLIRIHHVKEGKSCDPSHDDCE